MKNVTPKKLLGILCFFPAGVMIICAVQIWPLIKDDYYGWANILLSVVAFLTGVSYVFLAMAIWWPERHKRFWHWWRGD